MCGRKLATQNFAEEIRTDQKLREHLLRPSEKRLVCHCLPTQECHADSIIAEYKRLFPEAYDSEDTKGAVPSSAVLSRLAQLRLEPDSDGGSTPDEGAPRRGSEWTERGSPLLWDPAVQYEKSATVSRSRPQVAGLWTTGGIRKIPFGARWPSVT